MIKDGEPECAPGAWATLSLTGPTSRELEYRLEFLLGTMGRGGEFLGKLTSQHFFFLYQQETYCYTAWSIIRFSFL